jgi:diguanylate cyclase (GGDEF)-like protein
MSISSNPVSPEKFLSSPTIVEHFSLLQDIGILGYIDSLNRQICSYENLFTGALDIFNRISIDEIIDATVGQIADHFLPSFIAFLWKPMQNKEEIIIRGYKDYKIADLGLNVDSITPFEKFFEQFPRPINYDLFAFEIDNKAALQVFEPLQPELVIPIMGPSRLYGLILVGHKTLEAEYTQEELFFLQRLMSFVSLAVQNHLHYEQTLKDVKTGLFNHGFFITRLSEEVARTKRGNLASSIIVMDVDKFKNFNDSYGHLAGDQVLESIAFAIKQGVRLEDVPSRFGGEEFTVLLPNTDSEAAWIAAERLRTSIADMKVPWTPALPQVTISLGVFTFTHETDLSPADIIRRADEALYLSKERGRNRTTIWGFENPA